MLICRQVRIPLGAFRALRAGGFGLELGSGVSETGSGASYPPGTPFASSRLRRPRPGAAASRAIYPGRGISLKCLGSHVDLNGPGPAPMTSSEVPFVSAVALRRTEGSLTATAEPRPRRASSPSKANLASPSRRRYSSCCPLSRSSCSSTSDCSACVATNRLAPNASIPSACWSGYQVGSSGPPSETGAIAAIP
jgi:hypothetical protein